MPVIANPKLNGAELIRDLKKTGTSPAKLELASQLLGFLWRTEKRVASANEIIDALEKSGIMDPYKAHPVTPPLTLKKAITLASTGKWDGPVEVTELSLEEKILAGDTLAVAPPPVTPLEAMSVPGSSEPLPSDADLAKEKFMPTLEPKPNPNPAKRPPGRPPGIKKVEVDLAPVTVPE